MTTRLDRRFAALAEEGRAGLVTYISAGDPDLDTSAKLLAGLPAAGADVIELGVPFTDPVADGPAIQAAGLRALQAGASLAGTLEMVRNFRKQDDDTPIVLMGYFNPIYRYGTARFARDAVEAGVDGLITVDLPPEEEAELQEPAHGSGLDLVRLIAPTTPDARLHRLLQQASGFIYYVSIAGITGTASATREQIETAMQRLKGATGLPVAVGFGIKTPAQAAEVAACADAAVVGSAIVNRVASGLDDQGRPTPGLVGDVLGFVRELADGVRQARNVHA